MILKVISWSKISNRVRPLSRSEMSQIVWWMVWIAHWWGLNRDTLSHGIMILSKCWALSRTRFKCPKGRSDNKSWTMRSTGSLFDCLKTCYWGVYCPNYPVTPRLVFLDWVSYRSWSSCFWWVFHWWLIWFVSCLKC